MRHQAQFWCDLLKFETCCGSTDSVRPWRESRSIRTLLQVLVEMYKIIEERNQSTLRSSGYFSFTQESFSTLSYLVQALLAMGLLCKRGSIEGFHSLISDYYYWQESAFGVRTRLFVVWGCVVSNSIRWLCHKHRWPSTTIDKTSGAGQAPIEIHSTRDQGGMLIDGKEKAIRVGREIRQWFIDLSS